MKVKQILTIAFFLSLISLKMMAQQWVASPASANLLPDNYTVSSIKIVDKDIIWATATYTGSTLPPNQLIKVLRTTNGGQTWEVKNVTATTVSTGFNIQAFDAKTAWITTSDRSASKVALFKTTDGGQTWVEKLNNKSAGLYLRFFDLNNGVCIGSSRQFAYTSNGGEDWTIDSTSMPFVGREMTDVYASGTNNFVTKGDSVWFGTSAGRIMRSTNKGRNWTAFSMGISPTWIIASVAFSDAQNGMLVGLDSSTYAYKGIAKTNDGGINWQVIPLTAFSTTFKWFPIITAIPNKNKKTYLFGIENSVSTTASSLLTIDDGNSWFGLDKDIHSHGASEFISPQIGWMGNGYVKNATNPVTMFKWQEDGVLSPTAELYDNTFFSVNPNPTEDILNLQFEDALNVDAFDARISDVAGKVVFQTKTSDKQLIIKHLQSGIYFLTVKIKDKIGVVKFVKN
jgi:photosystem II stability/assembly factor-like uncharacterized protein